MSPPSPPTSRVDLGELKSQLTKRLGIVRSRRYFGYLHRLLSQKLSKSDFDRLCFLTLGRENLPLHNQLIRSVLRNAYLAKAPPNQKIALKIEDGLNPPQAHIGKANSVVQQNGDLCSCAHDQAREQTEQHVKWCRLSSKGLEDVVIKENGERFEHRDDVKTCLGPLRAPLGISLCKSRIGRMKTSLPWAESTAIDRCSRCLDNGELCHTEDLRKRMECVAALQGIGVAAECAVLMNNGLDAYLKQLIKSSIELVGSRMDRETIKQPLQKHEVYGKLINGVWLDNHTHSLSSNGSLELQERKCCLISLQDFTGAMELNPQQLGTNAPLLLEKIRLHSLTE